MKQIDSITKVQLQTMAAKIYGSFVKAVAQITGGLCRMHVDEEQYLLAQGSRRSNLWGLNLYPNKFTAKANPHKTETKLQSCLKVAECPHSTVKTETLIGNV